MATTAAAIRSIFRSSSLRSAAACASSQPKAARSPFRIGSQNSLSNHIFRLWLHLKRRRGLFEKPQVEVKSFPAEAINPLACNSEGTYIVGGGGSGDIHLWEIATGRLLKKWHGCLVFSMDQLLLISGAKHGSVRVWSLLMIFDEKRQQRSGHLYEYSFTEHALLVTDIVTGYGGSNAIIVSSSQDRTCKVYIRGGNYDPKSLIWVILGYL